MATKTVEMELRALEKQYWQALEAKDIDAAMRLTDFPCIVTGAQGIGRIDEQTFAAMMKDASYAIRRVELDDSAMEVRLVSDDVAVVGYKVHEELTVDGGLSRSTRPTRRPGFAATGVGAARNIARP